ncbi:hypothetical protein FA13DRAFT_1832692 [Coprinellus micaceus]|uniref:Uncharacterized protein n=1 Tax=Coprinellus micaceus TaxID=71717 RepID=A0A4Y7SHI2_COPMI|nr:hypothetical protein FA13DRAFT_1832692 [Coprinellus micaceus]
MTDAVIRGARNEGLETVRPKKQMNKAVIRELSKGMTEEQFWATFVQCLFCKAVIFRETFGANHTCDIETHQSRRYNPYSTPAKTSMKATRPRAVASRLQRTYALTNIPNGPIPTAPFPGINEGQAPSVFSEGDTDIEPLGDGDGDSSETASDEDEGRASGSSVPTGETSSDTEEEPIFSSDVELPSITQVFEQWRQEKRVARRSG